MKVALKIYASVGDIYSQTRVLCYLGEENKALALVNSGNDRLSYSHMAKHYETTGNIQQAVNFFIRANAYSKLIHLFYLCNYNKSLLQVMQSAYVENII